MNQETVQILDAIPKNTYLAAKILDGESQVISNGRATVLEDGSGLYEPHVQTHTDTITKSASFVQLGCHPVLKLVQIEWHGPHNEHCHFQV
jgi:hypothetical protein